MNTILHHPDASIRVAVEKGRSAISVVPRHGLFTPTRQWVTDYPLDLLEHVLRVKGPAYLCDEIMRDESPLYVQHCLRWDILSYASEQEFSARRILDFGSGSGASAMVLARMFPEAQIIGVELTSEHVELARHRARYHGVEGRVNFMVSPDPSSLPPNIGQFDFIVFSAVYEHLLPAERPVILGLLWAHLKEGGIVFLDQTPHRWFPVEAHTTGLPFINYLPDRLAHLCARLFSKRVSRGESWSSLLRQGIRGGTASEVMDFLNQAGKGAELLSPKFQGVRDPIDLWYQLSSAQRRPLTKKMMMWALRTIQALTGVTLVPTLSLAISKLR